MQQLRPRFLLLIILLICGSNPLIAKEGEAQLVGYGALSTDASFTGYYFLMQTDKAEKNKNKYQLVIADANMNTVAEKTITEDKGYQFTSSAFNGSNIILKYVGTPAERQDGDEGGIKQMVKIYDLQLNQVKTRSTPLGNIANHANFLEHNNKTSFMVLPAADGFISINTVNTQNEKNLISGKVIREGYMLEYIPTDNAKNGWRYKTAGGRFEVMRYLGKSDRFVFVGSMEKEKLMSRDLDYKIIAFDIATGKKAWQINEAKSEYALQPVQVIPMPDGLSLFAGVYYNKNQKAADADCLGLFAITTDTTGNPVKTVYMPWTDLNKNAAEADEDFKKSNLFLQDIVRVSNGNLFLVTERYKETISASLGNILSRAQTLGTAGTKKINARDLVIIEMTPSLEVKGVQTFAKPKNSVEVMDAIGMPTVEFLLYTSDNPFDYTLTQRGSNNDDFVVYYTMQNGKNDKSLGAVAYHNGSFTQDKIPVDATATWRDILPNNYGSIGLFEYFRKDKRFERRVVKINY